MADYGFNIRNSNNLRIIDNRFRCMEAVTWGSLSLAANTPVRVDWGGGVSLPMVWWRPESVGGLTWSNTLITQTYCYFVADRAMNMKFMISGFRNDGNAGGGYGLATFDSAGRVTFSTSRPYVRFPFGPWAGAGSIVPNTSFSFNKATWNGYTHPDWTPNTYMHMTSPRAWVRSGPNNNYMGVYFGGASQFSGQAFIDSNALINSPYHIGAYFATDPGTNIVPGTRLTCEFYTPS